MANPFQLNLSNKSVAQGVSKGLDYVLPILMHKQRLKSAKDLMSIKFQREDAKLAKEAIEAKDKMQITALQSQLKMRAESAQAAAKSGDTGTYQSSMGDVQSLSDKISRRLGIEPISYGGQNVAPAEESPEMFFPGGRQKPTSMFQLMQQNPKLWQQRLKQKATAEQSVQPVKVPTEFRKFEFYKFGKDSPEKRGTYEYRKAYLDYQKQENEATTAASKTEPAVLRKEFIAQSKDFVKVRDAYNRIKVSSDPPSAAGDLSMIFNYMKMLDPGSVVRESEFATAAATGSYGERIKAQVNKVMRGEKLSEAMRADFIDRSNKLYAAQENSHKLLRSEYDRLSKQLNVEPSDVIIKYITEETKIQDGKYDFGEVYKDASGTKMKYLGKDSSGEDLWEPVN